MTRTVDDRPFVDSLLLATYNTNGELRLCRVRIDFEKASISVQNLKLIASCTPAATAAEILSTTDDPIYVQTQLTTLDFIPAGPESKSRVPTQPFVLTAFSYLSRDFQGGEVANTVICKWELCSHKPVLHSSFAQLSPKRPTISAAAELPVGRLHH